MKSLPGIMLSGREVLPLIEGGKGISISNGLSAGAWAAAGGAGTFSGVNADFYDEKGHVVPIVYRGTTRVQRHQELIQQAIQGGIAQAKIAWEQACGQGRIHMNVLWEMGGVEPVLEGILSQARHMIHGITCGAGMPYRLAEIAARFEVYYLPIVSSARAFSILWRRAYSRMAQWLSAVVYEDPWKAGGHNGLSNQEDPLQPQDPYPRVVALRQAMNAVGLENTPIIMAGGVWRLDEWQDWIDNPAIGPIGFQFGTRPLVTQESPLSHEWKQRLMTLAPGDVVLNTFSPTGFYSSAVNNSFLQDLVARSQRQISYSASPIPPLNIPMSLGRQGRQVYISDQDAARVVQWQEQGWSVGLRTPDDTLVFVTPEEAETIHADQVNCMGCLSACLFSNWQQPGYSRGETVHTHEGPLTTGRRPDPRSFCIQKTLMDISHGGSLDHNLMFAGHNAYRFANDPFYADGFVPTVSQLIQRLYAGA